MGVCVYSNNLHGVRCVRLEEINACIYFLSLDYFTVQCIHNNIVIDTVLEVHVL